MKQPQSTASPRAEKGDRQHLAISVERELRWPEIALMPCIDACHMHESHTNTPTRSKSRSHRQIQTVLYPTIRPVSLQARRFRGNSFDIHHANCFISQLKSSGHPVSRICHLFSAACVRVFTTIIAAFISFLLRLFLFFSLRTADAKNSRIWQCLRLKLANNTLLSNQKSELTAAASLQSKSSMMSNEKLMAFCMVKQGCRYNQPGSLCQHKIGY